MVHTRSSMPNGNASSSEEKLMNGSYSDPTSGRPKLKRLKVPPVSDPGSVSTRLRSRTKGEEVTVESCKNASVFSSKAEVELILGEQDQVKERVCNGVVVEVTKEVESHRVNTPENRQKSIIGTKHLRGRTVSIVTHSPPNMGNKLSKSGDTVNEEKSDPKDHLVHSLAKSVSEPLELEESKIIDRNPNETVVGRRITRNGVATPSPLELNGEHKRVKKPRLSSNDTLPPSHPSSARDKVKEALRLFNETCKRIAQEEEARPKERNGSSSRLRVDIEASKILKSQGKSLNTGTHIIGPVPGVEVGDKFQSRTELNFLGIHRSNQAGIDYTKHESKKLIATSIVASEGYYDNKLDNKDVLIYTGQGGYFKKGKKKKCNEPKDQQLVKGNLALANSKHLKNPVRVIKGDSKSYVYDGLYLVEDFWRETGSHGKLVFKFKLRRVPGQREVSRKVRSKKLRDGLCDFDISGGEERLPICAVNEIDDEKPPVFSYTARMIYPDWCRPIPPKGCGCEKRCSESGNCCCVAKNGGELPYDEHGAIVSTTKPLVYECGPLCGCPPDCYLRVAQNGIKFPLEIFKTESRGWGVRSRSSIPSGSFICEYTGELLEEKEAERLAGKDEYLFDIGGKDHETSGFTIDAATKGNVGRFINHSCSPNLYAQNVLYDYEENRIPHVMFFAGDDIPPFQELSYDYNYVIDQVQDEEGNVRKKYCYCGSQECTGRLY